MSLDFLILICMNNVSYLLRVVRYRDRLKRTKVTLGRNRATRGRIYYHTSYIIRII